MKFKLSLVVAASLALLPLNANARTDDANALTQQVGALLAAGRGAEARGQTDTLADILGMDGGPMFVAVARDAARRLQDNGDTASAIAALDEAIRTAPQAPELYYARASVRLGTGNDQDAETDIAAVEHMARDNPALTAEVCVQRVLLDLKPAHGLALCDAAIAVSPEAPIIALKGVALVHQDQHEQALAYFARALALQPTNAIALYGRGYVGLSHDDHDGDHNHAAAEADITAAKLLDHDVGLRFPLLLEVH